ncbi:hypothetical protein KA005_75755 [bacterium]|nr:hypothetical protein [bacterium]
MPLIKTGALLYETFEGTDPYALPPDDEVGSIVSSISRGGTARRAIAVQEMNIALPNIGTMIGIYDPEVAALLSGEAG